MSIVEFESEAALIDWRSHRERREAQATGERKVLLGISDPGLRVERAFGMP